MTSWRATAALARAALVAGTGLAGAVVFGSPVMVVLTLPFALFAALGMLQLPRSTPVVDAQVDRYTLHEGQGTVSRLLLSETEDVEHVCRVSGRARFVAMKPGDGIVGRLWPGDLDIAISPRRWGSRRPGDEKIALTSGWAAWRWGPVVVLPRTLEVLPARASFDSRAELPQPLGLVGTHRSRRVGTGSEFSSIRPFQSGDPIRRVNWRLSLRTGHLHVISTRAEEDSAVLVFVDASADYGSSGGVDGSASSLDLSVRAAAAIAEHFVRQGDRVALKVLGAVPTQVGYGGGTRHQQRILHALARVQPGRPLERVPQRLDFGVGAGTFVVVLTPLLEEVVTNATAGLVRHGLPVMVIDTLPEGNPMAHREGLDPTIADLAWRLRRMERDTLVEQLAATGCPVVRWRGPGTLDEVLHRLARRAAAPTVSR
jgi:uncharacterized protein (DUF58 family)